MDLTTLASIAGIVGAVAGVLALLPLVRRRRSHGPPESRREVWGSDQESRMYYSRPDIAGFLRAESFSLMEEYVRLVQDIEAGKPNADTFDGAFQFLQDVERKLGSGSLIATFPQLSNFWRQLNKARILVARESRRSSLVEGVRLGADRPVATELVEHIDILRQARTDLRNLIVECLEARRRHDLP